MIIVADLLCKSISHEKVNSGFLHALHLAFPGEKIRFYAEKGHIDAIKNILTHDEVLINDLEYRSINVFFKPLALILLLEKTLRCGVDKVFLLSFSASILLSIKVLKKINPYSGLKFNFVLHSNFETIAKDSNTCRMDLPLSTLPVSAKKNLAKKLRKVGLKNLPKIVFRKVTQITFDALAPRNDGFLSVKNLMSIWHADDYRYIALSPHVPSNAKKYLDTEAIKIFSVVLPTNFVKAKPFSKNSYVKFATFGFGDSLVMYNVANMLSQRRISRPYEIRIIGMDGRGTESFPNVTAISDGRQLERHHMEFLAEDIDAFLILYDKSRYRLTCSGSILESLSLVKPVIHFDNDCINYFNKEALPIGYKCNNLVEYIDKLVDIIENYDSYHNQFESFRRNIEILRKECSASAYAPQLRVSFSW